MPLDFDRISLVYQKMADKLASVRFSVSNPLTLSEKIFYTHLAECPPRAIERGSGYADFFPDRVAMQDTTAQMALLQFASSSKGKTAVPASVHGDHLIAAEIGAKEDLENALQEHKEVFDFLESACNKYGVGYWKPGAGIAHQVILENYAFPGGLMIGTDSHVCTAGGLAMMAFDAGGTDAADVMAGMTWEFKFPKIIGVRLSGRLKGWASAKDVFFFLAGKLAAGAAAGAVIEYFGEGAASISCSGKAAICSMGAEIGASASLFPYDHTMAAFLEATCRAEVASLAAKAAGCLIADPDVYRCPDQYFDLVIDIDLSQIEPMISGPLGFHKAVQLSDFAKLVRQNGYVEHLSAVLIGSCTNASYQDLARAASVAKQALKHGLKAKCMLMISPGSELVRASLMRHGLLKILQDAGGVLLANACGPSIGQWRRRDVEFGERNSILTSYNRSASGCYDANPGTQAFVVSAELAAAFAFAGTLAFNPLADTLINEQGLPVNLDVPEAEELPANGFDAGMSGYAPPASDGSKVRIALESSSKRLQALEPFKPWPKKDFTDLRALVKVRGRCMIDQVSPAGKWLKFRGHLDNISENLFSGAVNAFREEVGKGKNLLSGEVEPFAKIARDYKKEEVGWLAIGEDHYGEGSSREYAAMELRHMGGVAVIAKSFAHNHEANLKKQGILALTFANPSDFDKCREDDLFDLIGISSFSPGIPFELLIKHGDGTSERISLKHTCSELQIEWFWAGSALNYSSCQLPIQQNAQSVAGI